MDAPITSKQDNAGSVAKLSKTKDLKSMSINLSLRLEPRTPLEKENGQFRLLLMKR